MIEFFILSTKKKMQKNYEKELKQLKWKKDLPFSVQPMMTRSVHNLKTIYLEKCSSNQRSYTEVSLPRISHDTSRLILRDVIALNARTRLTTGRNCSEFVPFRRWSGSHFFRLQNRRGVRGAGCGAWGVRCGVRGGELSTVLSLSLLLFFVLNLALS